MADKGDPRDIRRLQEEIKENERRINDLEEEVRKLREKLKDHEENCQPKIKKLEEELERLKKENNTLKEKVRKLEKEMEGLKTKMVDLKESNTDLEKRIKEFELSEDELIIRQLCSSVQENILRIVLQEYFDEIENKSIRDIEKYITQIEDKDKQKEKRKQDQARERWVQLREEIEWDDYLIKQLKSVKTRGNETAHPHLTEEKIEKAKMNLKEKKKLGKNNVKAVDKLKSILNQTKSKLTWNRLGPRKRSAESRDRGGPSRNLFATGQSQGASKAARGHHDISTKA